MRSLLVKFQDASFRFKVVLTVSKNSFTLKNECTTVLQFSISLRTFAMYGKNKANYWWVVPLPILADCGSFICSCRKTFICGVASGSLEYFFKTFANANLLLFDIQRPSRSFTCIRVDYTVAHNLSAPHEANAALRFAGFEMLYFSSLLSSLLYRRHFNIFAQFF